jgi:hypothetical protein
MAATAWLAPAGKRTYQPSMACTPIETVWPSPKSLGCCHKMQHHCGRMAMAEIAVGSPGNLMTISTLFSRLVVYGYMP